MPSHLFTNFEYYENEPTFNGIYSRNILSTINDEVFLINLDDYESTGTHQIALYVISKNVTCLIVLELSLFQKKLENLLETKII